MQTEIELFTETVDRLIAVEQQIKDNENISLEDVSEIETELSAIDFQIPSEYRTGISLEAGFFKNIGLKIKELWDAFVEWLKGFFKNSWFDSDSGIAKHTKKKVDAVDKAAKNAGKVDKSPIVGKDNTTPLTGIVPDKEGFYFGKINILKANKGKNLYDATSTMVDKLELAVSNLEIYATDLADIYTDLYNVLRRSTSDNIDLGPFIDNVNLITREYIQEVVLDGSGDITTPCTIVDIAPSTNEANGNTIVVPKFTKKVVVTKPPKYKFYGKSTHSKFDKLGVSGNYTKQTIKAVGVAQSKLHRIIEVIDDLPNLKDANRTLLIKIINEGIKMLLTDSYKLTETCGALVKVGKEINAASHKGNVKKGRVKPFCN